MLNYQALINGILGHSLDKSYSKVINYISLIVQTCSAFKFTRPSSKSVEISNILSVYNRGGVSVQNGHSKTYICECEQVKS